MHLRVIEQNKWHSLHLKAFALQQKSLAFEPCHCQDLNFSFTFIYSKLDSIFFEVGKKSNCLYCQLTCSIS